jgi:hypothetical protein
LAPRIVENTIEAWLGQPTPEVPAPRTPGESDFWRADGAGHLYLQRGFHEDGGGQAERVFDVVTPIWRVGEALLFVSRLGQLFSADPQIFVRVHYTGLRDRLLVSTERRMFLRGNRISADNEFGAEAQASASQIEDNLVEILHQLLSPLYERFNFFELPLALVTREMEQMRRNRF